MIHILDKQSDDIVATLQSELLEAYHEEFIEQQETLNFISTINEKAKYIAERNRLVIAGEDGIYREFVLNRVEKTGEKVYGYSVASFLDLNKQKVITPFTLEGQTLEAIVGYVLSGTEWQIGLTEFAGSQKVIFENPNGAYTALKQLCTLFDVEMRFRIEVEGNKIMGRYVDFFKKRGQFVGKEVKFGKDLIEIRRIEDSANIVTALKCYGPEKEDGTRLVIDIVDDDAFQRWNRNGKHLWGIYEPLSEDGDMTEERLRTLGRTELNKRINSIVQYESTQVALNKVKGLEHEKVVIADIVRAKDTHYQPPLYLEARVRRVKRNILDESEKDYTLGDFIEYAEEDVRERFKALQELLKKRAELLVIASIVSSAGNVFKNGVGSTELEAKTFLAGNEVDADGSKYEYRWYKYDKEGHLDPDFHEVRKEITINASAIDEKASYMVEIVSNAKLITVSQITLSNVFDGDDGFPGKDGEDGKDGYTPIKDVDYFDGKDGQDGADGVDGTDGTDGQGIENVVIEYYNSTSDTLQAGGSWTTTKPAWEANRYLWTRNKITYKNPSSTDYTSPVLDDSWKAITTADGKNTVIYSPSEPPIGGRKVNDVWFDTDDDYKMYRFNGSAWIAAQFGENAIVANSITANHIKSLLGLNVNDQFIVDENGNVRFAGELSGASGVFSGDVSGATGRFGNVSVKDGNFTLEDDTTSGKYNIVPGTNMLNDHSFEGVPLNQNASLWHNIYRPVDITKMQSGNIYGDWGRTGTPYVDSISGTDLSSELIMFGSKQMLVNNANYVRQMTRCNPGAVFTASAHFGRPSTSAILAGVPKIIIYFRGLNGEFIAQTVGTFETPSKIGGSRSFERNVITSSPAPAGTEFVEIVCVSDNSGWVVVDGVQLLSGSIASIYDDESTTYDLMNGLAIARELIGEFIQSVSGRFEGLRASLNLNYDSTSPFVQSLDVQNRTYPYATNMFVSGTGVIGRATSASKYKLNIKEVETEGLAEKVLKLKIKSWYDKPSCEAYADYLTEHDGDGSGLSESGEHIIPIERHYGLVAEDLVNAGLSMYVQYGEPDDTGNREVEGIAYDRLWTLLIPIVKKQQKEIDELRRKIERVDELERKVEMLMNVVQQSEG